MPKNSYFRTLVTVEILSNDPYTGDESLSEIANAITYGSDSGLVTIHKSVSLSKQKMQKALEKQGSDPTFLD